MCVIVDASLGCRSNDLHVLALARVSGARTLCTADGDLRRDFKDSRLVARPKGSIYSRASHAHLLKHSTSCGRERRRKTTR